MENAYRAANQPSSVGNNSDIRDDVLETGGYCRVV